jgi:hypothetical protein
MKQIAWDILKIRAENYLAACEAILASNNPALIQTALENMHFALELSMKAVIAKNGGHYPEYGKRGHDLEGLIIHKFENGALSILALAKQANVISLFNVGLSAWSMDCRYFSMKNYEDIKASINDYKELYKWIKDSLLK